MSFIEDLAQKHRRKGREGVLSPSAQSIPLSLPQAQGGLASSFREPYRVNGPVNAPMVPSIRSRESILAPTTFRR